MGLRKINTLDIKQANKVMHLLAIAYNTSTSSARPQEVFKVHSKIGKSGAKALLPIVLENNWVIVSIIMILSLTKVNFSTMNLK
ncbi:MAG: transposase [Flavobacteriales bacterium]|nr:transposase [Flavobacteriales bacterium]